MQNISIILCAAALPQTQKGKKYKGYDSWFSGVCKNPTIVAIFYSKFDSNFTYK